MRSISNKKMMDARKHGKIIGISDEPGQKAKTVNQKENQIQNAIDLLYQILKKEAPAPIITFEPSITVSPAEMVMPETAKAWTIDVTKRDDMGRIKTVKMTRTKA